MYLRQEPATFSLPRAALAIHMFCPGPQKKINAVDSKRNCISLTRLKTGISCVHPYIKTLFRQLSNSFDFKSLKILQNVSY
jgi:hypothetical protein